MATNYTNVEYLRMFGSLSVERVERLVDAEAGQVDPSMVLPCLEEARGCFPAEDFLSSVLGRLYRLAKNVRGANRDEVMAIAAALEEINDATYNESDYGRSELDKAIAYVANTAPRTS